MSQYTNNPYISIDGMHWEVNVGAKCQYFINQTRLKAMIRQLNLMQEAYARVICISFQLHLPEGAYSDDNKCISNFFRHSKTLLTRTHKLKKIGYCWARERSKSSQQHYHVWLFLEGRKVQSSHRIIEFLKSQWKEITIEGKLSVPEHCYYKLHRDNIQLKREIIYRLSYLTKERSKETIHQLKKYGCSRLL
ncbi:TPA: inovirus-type Gp2 protein [Vibrio parahaemolyticus]|uniref:YagK/YfjJ domain-containing protein n=1 Tax=Vibrio harveyi group TaxID=717610 RepID=UPI000677077C|nr:inovirus Gp2 family protein [Vibrio parahaemolyticus]ELA6601863.1 inovirus-type Gp2 protein [Vibrio alginolyticus]EGQ9887412.1 inovirus Gp2 family protein [Vibrio parahaemolyticus]EJG1091435.1 inovirus-type Gp2 protein [Vibrio parahaemolyticus]EKB1971835.1 inovirus-type Gp2 protein [Vibrio parahaemolyticus]